MNLSVGIVGLPNVGKSTLFNALLKKQAALAANYPFATVEPNIGIVPVPDTRLSKLADVVKTEENLPGLPPIKSATVEFVDIAGLVKGASKGEGLGNMFLANIREVSLIAHVVRDFTDENIIREGSSDPENDYAVISTELILSDLQTVENSLKKIKKNQSFEISVLEKLKEELDLGTPARYAELSEEEREFVRGLFLLTDKPEVVVLNVDEDKYNSEKIKSLHDRYSSLLQKRFASVVVICAKVESDLAELSDSEQREFIESLGLEKSGLEELIQASYSRLNLVSFLTAGEKEVRAWTINKGISAPEAAGAIHTDFTKKFIKAEVITYDDYISLGGRKTARDKGRARLEGKDYTVQDGDVIEFKIGA
jgi:ribosome-binding ATPase